MKIAFGRCCSWLQGQKLLQWKWKSTPPCWTNLNFLSLWVHTLRTGSWVWLPPSISWRNPLTWQCWWEVGGCWQDGQYNIWINCEISRMLGISSVMHFAIANIYKCNYPRITLPTVKLSIMVVIVQLASQYQPSKTKYMVGPIITFITDLYNSRI